MTSTMSVKVWRGKAEGGFSHYEVPRLASQTVLDVVTHIQRQLEGLNSGDTILIAPIESRLLRLSDTR